MSTTKKLCLVAGAAMLLFYLSKRKAPGGDPNEGRPGYFFDGYGWVSNNGHY